MGMILIGCVGYILADVCVWRILQHEIIERNTKQP